MTPAQFRALLAKAGLNQSTGAERLGVSRRTVIRWLNGETPISARNALFIKTVLSAK